jgi:hypothetical protein
MSKKNEQPGNGCSVAVIIQAKTFAASAWEIAMMANPLSLYALPRTEKADPETWEVYQY